MKFFLALIFTLTGIGLLAQDTTSKPWKKTEDDLEPNGFWDHCFSGGDIMFYGGTGSLYFNISPMLGYRPGNKTFSYGIGATYQYSRFSYYSAVYKFSLYGLRAFIRQDLGKMFFIHGELEDYFTKGQNIFTKKEELISFPCANAFIGFKQSYSQFSYYYIMIGYEFIGDPKAQNYAYPFHPYLIKAGYVFDLKGK